MGELCPPTPFSLAMDGKHHDAIFSVDRGVVAVIYWAPHGAVRRTAEAQDSEQPEATARELLRQMIWEVH